MKLLFTTLFYLFIFTISGQSIVYFEGIVIEDKSKDPVPDVVIVNVRNESSWVSDIYEWGRNSAKWKYAQEYCKDRDWDFMILTEDHLMPKYK